MASIKYLAMAIAFFAVACFVIAIGMMVAPNAFLGSITGKFEARSSSTASTQSPRVTSLSSPLLGSKPERVAKDSVDVSDRNGDWVAVVDAVNMRSNASSAAPVLKVQSKGVRLRVLSRNGNWINVVEPGTSLQGWVHKKYVQSAESDSRQTRIANAKLE
jgi:Bacterial SH3 domain